MYRQTELRFLGHVVDASDLKSDLSKVSAISELKALINVHELKRALGMINYMGKCISDLASAVGPLFELLKEKKKHVGMVSGTAASIPDTEGRPYHLTCPCVGRRLFQRTRAAMV